LAALRARENTRDATKAGAVTTWEALWVQAPFEFNRRTNREGALIISISRDYDCIDLARIDREIGRGTLISPVARSSLARRVPA